MQLNKDTSDNEIIFIFIGGANKNNEPTEKILILNSELDEIISMTSLLEPRAAHRIVSAKSTIYVSGG